MREVYPVKEGGNAISYQVDLSRKKFLERVRQPVLKRVYSPCSFRGEKSANIFKFGRKKKT